MLPPSAVVPAGSTAREPRSNPFGHAMLAHWALDPTIAYLNHGTVGATPRRVLAAQQAVRDEIERQPSRFLLRELTAIDMGARHPGPPRMRAAADVVGAFVGARGDDLAFVDNATTGVNAAMRSLALRPGDEILITSYVYGAVANIARFVARERGAVVKTVEIPFPLHDPGEVVSAIAAAVGPRTRVVVADHITSETALLLPLAEIAARCRSRGVPVLADGAHAPGAIALDIPALGVDWYVANLHKWAWVPRSSGILWAPLGRQAGLHPAVLSWGLDQGYTAEFDLVGTRDPSAHLAAPAAIAFLRELGFEAVCAHNHALAVSAARLLAARWGTALASPESMIATMATVPL
ncbi:MAG: aminotransferase class V-fold PLP-dependent enzyme, partial [Candidatus Eisenbacteria bacterium]